jgi:uncharacterized protein YndB with AHSA1/START domain
MEIERDAPVQAQADMYIGAPPAEVWQVLSDVGRWPEWNPDVRDVSINGPVAAGSVFTWRVGRASITSTIREVREAQEIGWTGRTTGITAAHVWRLEAHAAGTHVTTAESWTGLMPRLLPGRFTRSLQRSLDKGLGYLDAEFGRRAIAAAAHELEQAAAAHEAEQTQAAADSAAAA